MVKESGKSSRRRESGITVALEIPGDIKDLDNNLQGTNAIINALEDLLNKLRNLSTHGFRINFRGVTTEPQLSFRLIHMSQVQNYRAAGTPVTALKLPPDIETKLTPNEGPAILTVRQLTACSESVLMRKYRLTQEEVAIVTKALEERGSQLSKAGPQGRPRKSR
jgi:hypothetical protein